MRHIGLTAFLVMALSGCGAHQSLVPEPLVEEEIVDHLRVSLSAMSPQGQISNDSEGVEIAAFDFAARGCDVEVRAWEARLIGIVNEHALRGVVHVVDDDAVTVFTATPSDLLGGRSTARRLTAYQVIPNGKRLRLWVRVSTRPPSTGTISVALGNVQYHCVDGGNEVATYFVDSHGLRIVQ